MYIASDGLSSTHALWTKVWIGELATQITYRSPDAIEVKDILWQIVVEDGAIPQLE